MERSNEHHHRLKRFRERRADSYDYKHGSHSDDNSEDPYNCEKITGKKPDPPKPKEDKPKDPPGDASDKYDKYDKYASKSSDDICKAKDLTCADHYTRYDAKHKGEESEKSSKDADTITSTAKPKKSFPFYKKEPVRIMKFDKDEEIKEKGKLEDKSKDIYGAEDLDWEPTHYYDERDYKPKKKSVKHKLVDMLKELEFHDDVIDLDGALSKKNKDKKKESKKDKKSEKKEKDEDKKLGPLQKELKKLKSNVSSVKKLV